VSGYDHRVLDTVIHSRIRLAIVALLAAVDDAEFTHIRDEVGTTDGNLGNHLGRLAETGYVEGVRELDDGRPVTRYRLTDDGRAAFTRYVAHLEALLHGAEGAPAHRAGAPPPDDSATSSPSSSSTGSTS
jgi:predicted ArsR family transcriptional regulator